MNCWVAARVMPGSQNLPGAIISQPIWIGFSRKVQEMDFDTPNMGKCPQMMKFWTKRLWVMGFPGPQNLPGAISQPIWIEFLAELKLTSDKNRRRIFSPQTWVDALR